MSGKSFTDQMRRRNRRKKRQRQSHQHDGEEEDLQSQDLLAGDEQEPLQHQEQVQNEVQETENVNEEQEAENGRENDQAAASETKVQADEPLSVRQAANNHENVHEQAVPRIPVEAQAQQHYGNNPAVVQNRMDPPPVHGPTEEEERLKGLLSHYIITVRNLERSNQRYQQELHAARQECQKLKQALEKSRQKCKEYHKKYSAIKRKFYHWYNHFLQQWAAKFSQGQTQDLPPGPDTVGGLSPPALQEHDNEDAASVLSALQPRRIFQDNSSSSSGSSTSPSPMAERNDLSVLPVQDQRPTESNQRNENLHPNVQARPMVQGGNESKDSAVGDSSDTTIEPKQKENDEMQIEAPSKKSPQKKEDTSTGIDEDETQLNDPSQENVHAKPQAKEATMKADDASDQSVCSDTQMILPPEDEASVQSSDDENDDTQLNFPDSLHQSKKSEQQAQGHEQVQISESHVDARREKLLLDQDDKTSSSGAARQPWEAPPARKVSLSPNRGASSAAAFRRRPDESLPIENAVSNRRDKQREVPELDSSSRRAPKSLSGNKKRESMQSEQEHEETSQALFSQLPPTPPQNNTTKPTPTASKGRASSKNASALRAMEGWTSNVVARAFVQTTSMNPPAKKKQRVTNELFKPDTVPSNTTAATSTKKSNSTGKSLSKAPARNPYARSNEKNATPKATAGMDWSDDEDKDDSPAQPYKYQEVVRCRHNRQQLPGHCCPECDKFAESLDGDVFDKKDFLGMSRHRARHTPENTPPGFWELSFADEIEARKRNKDDA